MKIICFGDSNTWGYDPRSYLGERYPKDVRWTGLLSALPGLEVVNCGVNGRTIPNTPARVSAACAELGRYLPADVLLVMLGGNDLLCSPDFRAENVAERMERFLRDALPRLEPGERCSSRPRPCGPGPGSMRSGSSRSLRASGSASRGRRRCSAWSLRTPRPGRRGSALTACTSMRRGTGPFSRASGARWGFEDGSATNPLFIFAAGRGILYCHYLKEVSAWARTI